MPIGWLLLSIMITERSLWGWSGFLLLRLEPRGLGLSPAAPIPCSNRSIFSVVDFPVGAGVV